MMLIIPNSIWLKYQPHNYNFKKENKILLVLERVGQILVTCVVLLFSNFNLKPYSLWSILLIISFIFMLMYEFWWIRYFKSKRTLKDFYSSFYGVPVAGATLPVLGFLFLGIYGKAIWLIIATIILGIGHIGIHLQHLRQINK